jgi:heme-degrading monooxygenase HmoA
MRRNTVWQNRATFEAWTKSEAFRAAGSGKAAVA